MQYLQAGGSSECQLLLLDIQRALRDVPSLSRRDHAGAVLHYRKLCVADLDAHLILKLLQVKLCLSIFQFGADLVGLRNSIAQWNVKRESDRVIRGAAIESA